MRSFVAIDLPEAAREALERLQDDLPVGRPLAPETFHLTLAFLCLANTDAADPRPNFLFVVADDMGWTHLGCFGSEIEPT